MPSELWFQQPSRLWWALAILVAAVVFLWLRNKMAPAVEKRLTSTADLLKQAEREVGNRWRRWIPVLLTVLAFCALILQYAEPVAAQRVRRPALIVLAVDNSLSTLAIELEDQPTVLEKIQAEALALIEAVRNGDEVAIVTFADEAILSQPPTADKVQLRELVSSLESEVETDLGGALLEAHRLARTAPVATHVIVLSDGMASDQNSNSVTLAVDRLVEDDITVSTVLFGSPAGYILEDGIRRPFSNNPSIMASIAENTGGNFFEKPNSAEAIESAYDLIDQNELSFEKVSQGVTWFIPAAFILGLLAALAHLKIYRTRWAM